MRELELKGSEKIWCIDTYYHAYQTPSEYGQICIPYLTRIFLDSVDEYDRDIEKYLIVNHDGIFLVEIEEYSSNKNQSITSYAPTEWKSVRIKKVDLKDIDLCIDRIEIESEPEPED